MNRDRVKKFVKSSTSIAGLILVDLFSFYISFFVAFYIRVWIGNIFNLPQINYNDILMLYWVPLINIIIFMYEGLYTNRSHFWSESKLIIQIITLSTILIIGFLTFLQPPYEISRSFIFIFWLVSMIIFPIIRYYGKHLLFAMDIWSEPILILGYNKKATKIAELFESNRYLGYKVVGFMELDKELIYNTADMKNRKNKIATKLNDFCSYKSTYEIDVILVAIFGIGSKKLSELVMNLQQCTKKVLVMPESEDSFIQNSRNIDMFAQKLSLLEINNNLQVTIKYIIKKIFDYSLAIILLPILLPIIAIISILIKLDSKGDVFFIQDRIGRHGKSFKCIKFRTMYENSDEILQEYLANNPDAREEYRIYKKLRSYDPRITRMGHFFRKTSLDELAQIFNVLKGEMGFIGPRPYLPQEREDMGKNADVLLMFEPGITGLWQISGRNNLTFKKRVELDTWYVTNWSLWRDIYILIKTFKVVLKRSGAS